VLARLLVVELVRDYKMSAEQAAAWGRDKLHLAKLDASTVLDWFRDWFREVGDTVDRKAWLAGYQMKGTDLKTPTRPRTTLSVRTESSASGRTVTTACAHVRRYVRCWSCSASAVL